LTGVLFFCASVKELADLWITKLLKYVKLLKANLLIVKFEELYVFSLPRLMRIVLMILLLIISNQVVGQKITGLLLDADTRKPIKDAKVSTSNTSTFTAATGIFTFASIRQGDTIKVSHARYDLYQTAYNDKSKLDTVLIFLKLSAINLLEVNIQRVRNYKFDSLNRREEFPAVFNHKAPSFKDVFLKKSTVAPVQYSPFQSSTSSLVGINLLSVLNLIKKNKTPIAKLQKQLLKEEEDKFVNHKFSKEKVSSLTSLKGDSLQNFMIKYRPSMENSKGMTEYELLIYIKKCYKDFVKME
jgi:hypothetical protein